MDKTLIGTAARGARVTSVGLATILAGGLYSAAAEERGVYDHHVHLLSPALIDHWKSIGMRFSRPDESYSNPSLLLERLPLSASELEELLGNKSPRFDRP